MKKSLHSCPPLKAWTKWTSTLPWSSWEDIIACETNNHSTHGEMVECMNVCYKQLGFVCWIKTGHEYGILGAAILFLLKFAFW